MLYYDFTIKIFDHEVKVEHPINNCSKCKFVKHVKMALKWHRMTQNDHYLTSFDFVMLFCINTLQYNTIIQNITLNKEVTLTVFNFLKMYTFASDLKRISWPDSTWFSTQIPKRMSNFSE